MLLTSERLDPAEIFIYGLLELLPILRHIGVILSNIKLLKAQRAALPPTLIHGR